MTHVVILSWDSDARQLAYVEIRSGAGGAAATRDISAEAAELMALELAGHELPLTAQLEIVEDSDVLVDVASGTSVIRCGVRAVGPPNDRQLELRPKGSRTVVAKLPAASLGIEDPGSASAAEAFEFLYAEALSPPGCWLCEGGIDGWMRRRQQERIERIEAVAAAEAQRLAAEKADTTFINPYTFVPFPSEIVRCKPPGHDRLAEGRLSGIFTVTWEFTSPFQAPDGAAGTMPLRLPGSSVKGAVRSVHEAIAGGCLRVFDENFIPSYRDTAAVRSGWTLALVTEATKDGQPLIVQLCDEVVWVGAVQLRAACGATLSTGSRVTIAQHDVPGKLNSLGRKELAAGATVSSGGDWVVLVTPPGTRSKKTGAYFLACGKVGQRTAEVGESAWRAFRLAVAGADDLRRAVRQAASAHLRGSQPTEQVVFNSQPVGRRRVVTGELWSGDVIWVRTDAAGASPAVAEELSLAAIWRHPGWQTGADQRGDRDRWSARTRVPDHLRACDDPRSLCPSCRIFGSADQNARAGDERAEQRAYAGHVRFGDARSDRPVELTEILRAPMGAPRPGAGQFYLAYDDPSPAKDREARPTREWGSGPDTTAQRQLRGRKFYWHADPDLQRPPRHHARDHQAAGLAVKRWIAPSRTKLCQQISFDNLSTANLGGLLSAFQPQLVLPASEDRPLRLHLGGGKPLGLGSCIATVSSLFVWNAQSRYGGAPEIQPEPAAYVAEFNGQCPAGVTETWPALAAALAERTVDAARVWYPPGAYWPDRAVNEKAFDEPFAFFSASSGMFLTAEPKRRLIPLPSPEAEDQSLPIKRKADLQ